MTKSQAFAHTIKIEVKASESIERRKQKTK